MPEEIPLREWKLVEIEEITGIFVGIVETREEIEREFLRLGGTGRKWNSVELMELRQLLDGIDFVEAGTQRVKFVKSGVCVGNF